MQQYLWDPWRRSAMVLQYRMRGDVCRWANEKAVVPQAPVRRDDRCVAMRGNGEAMHNGK